MFLGKKKKQKVVDKIAAGRGCTKMLVSKDLPSFYERRKTGWKLNGQHSLTLRRSMSLGSDVDWVAAVVCLGRREKTWDLDRPGVAVTAGVCLGWRWTIFGVPVEEVFSGLVCLGRWSMAWDVCSDADVTARVICGDWGSRIWGRSEEVVAGLVCFKSVVEDLELIRVWLVAVSSASVAVVTTAWRHWLMLMLCQVALNPVMLQSRVANVCGEVGTGQGTVDTCPTSVSGQ